jgi:23S rRNA (cytosine1962-C5)-methyltransferase
MTEPVATRLDRALARREELSRELEGHTDAWRLVNAGGDQLEGLTADRLGEALLVERHRPDAPAEELSTALSRRFDTAPIVLKERWSRDPDDLAGRQVLGPPLPAGEHVVRELGLWFAVRLLAGEHVGLFLDARPARALVRGRAAGLRVLNLFGYTGGFGVAAARGGARSTTNVDTRRSALEAARRNYELNALPGDTRTFLRDDAIRFLTRAARGAGRYDLVVLDPPPRFKRAGGRTYDAREGYGRLVARCARVLDPGGLLLAGSNVFDEREKLERVVIEAARDAASEVEVVERVGPGPDFPPAAERPTGTFALVRVGRPGTGR